MFPKARAPIARLDRRTFVAALAGEALWASSGAMRGNLRDLASTGAVPAYSVIPVVGDGKWIWTRPPAEGRGVLEPRRFRLSVGVEITATGPTQEVLATTPVPAAFPEQAIDGERVAATGPAEAVVDSLSESARRLAVLTGHMDKGQTAGATATFELTLYKQYFGYQREQFPEQQVAPYPIRSAFLGDSPGIQTRSADVIERARDLRKGLVHPWDWAGAFADWVSHNIRPRLGPYTSVSKAMETRVGDCEEMAGVFIALCRASGLPARLVWVPNHVWSEVYLVDEHGIGHWIPIHTACYSWFGWTGAHELVLQKGDRLRVPDYGTLVRLQQDRTRSIGARPEVRFTAELTPLPPAGDGSVAPRESDADKPDPGPGARRKMPSGEWVLSGEHPADRYMRR